MKYFLKHTGYFYGQFKNNNFQPMPTNTTTNQLFDAESAFYAELSDTQAQSSLGGVNTISFGGESPSSLGITSTNFNLNSLTYSVSGTAENQAGRTRRFTASVTLPQEDSESFVAIGSGRAGGVGFFFF